MDIAMVNKMNAMLKGEPMKPGMKRKKSNMKTVKEFWNTNKDALQRHYTDDIVDKIPKHGCVPQVVDCHQVGNLALLLCLYDMMRAAMKLQHGSTPSLAGLWEPIGSKQANQQWGYFISELRGTHRSSRFKVMLINDIPVAFMAGLREETRRYYHLATGVTKIDYPLYLRFLYKHSSDAIKSLKVGEILFNHFIAGSDVDYVYLHYQKSQQTLGAFYQNTLGFKPVDLSTENEESMSDMISVAYADEPYKDRESRPVYDSESDVPLLREKARAYHLLTYDDNGDAVMIKHVAEAKCGACGKLVAKI